MVLSTYPNNLIIKFPGKYKRFYTADAKYTPTRDWGEKRRKARVLEAIPFP